MNCMGHGKGRHVFSAKGVVMPSGRTRQFDEEEALDRAMEVFWTRGYEGATLPELTAAMGINRPSLYAAFGNKEQLFRKALDRYRAGPVAFVAEALKEPTARGVAEAMFRGWSGCWGTQSTRAAWLCHAALACGEEAEPVRRELASRGRRWWPQAGSGSSRPFGRVICRRGRTARHCHATWSRSCTAWRCKRRAGRPKRN